MVRLAYFILIVISSMAPVLAQQASYRVEVSPGIAQVVAHDALVNPYRYAGYTAGSMQLRGVWEGARYGAQVQVLGLAATAQPVEFAEVYYEANSLRFKATNLKVNFWRSITFSPKLHLDLGLGYGAGFRNWTQTYRHVLYEAGQGTRRSYLRSVAQFSVDVQTHVLVQEGHQIGLRVGYSPLSYLARPTDNYVNLGHENPPQWGWYAWMNYYAYSLGLVYQWQLAEHWGLSLEYSHQHQFLAFPSVYAERIQRLGLGVVTYF